jgi:hypothetical protein
LKARWIFALLLLLAWIGGIGWRLYQLQVRDHEEYQELAKRQQLRRITLEPHRGTIYDARGRKLALSLEVDSAWACPRDVEDPATASIELSGVLGLDRQKLEEKLTKDKEFVWIARQLTRCASWPRRWLASPVSITRGWRGSRASMTRWSRASRSTEGFSVMLGSEPPHHRRSLLGMPSRAEISI